MRIKRWVPWWAALMGLFVVVLAGCDPVDGGVQEGQVEPPGVGGGGGGGCGEPGPNVSQRLPVVDSSFATFPNPCLPYSELVSTVTGYLPESDRASGAASRFFDNVGLVAGKLASAAGQAECLYQADQLAVQVYQERDVPLSVGVVVVLGVSAEAVGDFVSCYVLGKPQHDPGTDDPGFDPCLDFESDSDYVVFKVGSTESMCGALGAL